MSWFSGLGDAIGGIAKAISAPITEWQKRKTVKAEAKLKVTQLLAEAQVAKAQAQVRMAERGQQIEADWDARAQEAMKFSLKDEFVLAVFMAPYVLALFPGMQSVIENYFKILSDTVPVWHFVITLGIVASIYGLRWLVKPLVAHYFGGGNLFRGAGNGPDGPDTFGGNSALGGCEGQPDRDGGEAGPDRDEDGQRLPATRASP